MLEIYLEWGLHGLECMNFKSGGTWFMTFVSVDTFYSQWYSTSQLIKKVLMKKIVTMKTLTLYKSHNNLSKDVVKISSLITNSLTN